MSARPRIAVARLWLEVNAFCPAPSSFDDFRRFEWDAGEEALGAARGTATELGEVAARVDAGEIDAVVLRRAGAAPGGPMEEAVFAAFLSDLDAGLAHGSWDGVYLSLHGACQTPEIASCEEAVAQLVRRRVGRGVPVAASFDMHGNLSQNLATHLDIMSGYRTLPHLDMRETASRALDPLLAAIRGEIAPVCAQAHTNALIHSHHMRAPGDGPMAQAVRDAQSLQAGAVIDATPVGGFPFADTPWLGASAMATADGDRAAAQAAADAVAANLRALAPRFAASLPDARAGIERALSALRRGEGPVVVLDNADNVYSGGAADTPALLAALLEARPEVPAAFAFLWDPALVERARAAGVGATLDAAFGGRLTPDFGPPVRATAIVERQTDGRFVNESPMERGRPIDAGPSAVLKVGATRIVVGSSRTPANDLAWFRLHGIEPRDAPLLCVKGKNHVRAALGPLCPTLIDVDAPGPAQVDLSRFRYRRTPASRLAAWRR